MEKYPRGSRGSPAKGVVCDKRSEGSNPSFSATKRHPKKGAFFGGGERDFVSVLSSPVL